MLAEKPGRVGDELTIKEMAQQSGMSEHTLRYYERIGLLNPIPRNDSSGHRRYSADTIGTIESLACLRGTGMSIEDMRRYLKLREQGAAAAAEQRALFAAHEAALMGEMEVLRMRLKYLAGKVAYWSAIEDGDLDKARAIGADNHLIARALSKKKETR